MCFTQAGRSRTTHGAAPREADSFAPSDSEVTKYLSRDKEAQVSRTAAKPETEAPSPLHQLHDALSVHEEDLTL